MLRRIDSFSELFHALFPASFRLAAEAEPSVPLTDKVKNSKECERRLWATVLLLALADLSDKKRRRSAMRWIAESDPSVGGFRWICDHLQIDHLAAREKILRQERNSNF
jgi:hypothetical protein